MTKNKNSMELIGYDKTTNRDSNRTPGTSVFSPGINIKCLDPNTPLGEIKKITDDINKKPVTKEQGFLPIVSFQFCYNHQKKPYAEELIAEVLK